MQTPLLRLRGKLLGFAAGRRRRLLYHDVLPMFQRQRTSDEWLSGDDDEHDIHIRQQNLAGSATS
jgi:hypothetical protein